MSSDGGDSSNKPPGPPSTIAGVVPPQPRAGLPPPQRQAPGSQAPPYQPPGPPAAPPYGGQPPGPPGGSPYGAPPSPPGPLQPHAGQPPHGAPYGGPARSIPEAQLVQSESSPIEQAVEVLEKVPGRFLGFLKISAKRAFRLRIEPTEVLDDERAALAAANPPILDPTQQAFLAWRRSVLFLVATMLTVLSVIGLVDALGGYKVATPVRFVKLLPTLAEVAFCLICWLGLRNWTHWRAQRKWLLLGWLLFMLTPFAVFIYPLKSAVMDAKHVLTVDQMRELGWYGVYNKAVAPFAFAMIAMLQLAPKVISLMPGLIRSAMVIKLLFPGAAAPGWLIVMAAPLYAMIAYALLVIPYQFTASEWFGLGIVLIMVAQVFVTRSGFALAKPLTEAEAIKHIKRVRTFYMVVLVLSAACIIGGLGVLTKLLHMKWTSVVTTLLKFESNVLILTTIGADLVVTNLDRARAYTEGKEQIEAETELKIAAFVGINAPPTPPPPGPAHHP